MSAEANTPFKKGPIDIVKHRWWYVVISLAFLVPGLFYIVVNMTNPAIKAPVILGIDYTGGTMLEYGFHKPVAQQDIPTIRAAFDGAGYTGSVIQIQNPRMGINHPEDTQASADKSAVIDQKAQVKEDGSVDTKATATDSKAKEIQTIVSIRSKHLKGEDADKILAQLKSHYGDITVLQKYSIGPALASELLQNGVIALLLAYLLIVGYLTFRFEFDYAFCAIIALVHDALFVFGAFAVLGHFYHTEVDSMFITAILTVVGFSVHDTIVVFDRIRENYKLYYTKKVPFVDIANLSVNQTLARSINMSISTLITLFALYFFGGETTKNFVLASILGIIVGTFSSIFIASLALAWMREKQIVGATTKRAVAA